MFTSFSSRADDAVLAHAQIVELGRPAITTKLNLKSWIEEKIPHVRDANFMDIEHQWETVALAQSKVRTGPLESFIEKHFSQYIPRKVCHSSFLTPRSSSA